jgi:hypothetical protein
MLLLLFFKYIFIDFREEGRRRETETSMMKENHHSAVSYMPRTRGQACNPGMCSDWELNCDFLVHRLMLNH